MAPPYRRSCYSCVKAKRRCDLAAPRCQRCCKNDLVCDYKGKSSGAEIRAVSSGSTEDPIPFHSGSEDVTLVDAEFQADDDAAGLAHRVDNLEDMNSSRDTMAGSQLNFSGSLLTEDMPELTNNLLDQFLDTGSWSPAGAFDAEPTPVALEPLKGGEIPWISRQNQSQEIILNSPVLSLQPDDEFILSGDIYLARVKLVQRLLQACPGTFVEKGQNIFIHRQLCQAYHSDTIDDTLSCCSLYTGKNQHNEALVHRDIRRKVKQLLNQPPFQTHADQLVASQSLILYQIIRLFDGDIGLRAEAEKDLPTLDAWTNALVRRTEQISPDSFSGLLTNLHQTSIQCWDGWIFEESSRRTVLVAYMLQAVYSFLKDGVDKASAKVQKLSFSAQAALWDAPSHYHWKKAIAEKNRFQLRVGDWDKVMDGLTADDLEDLGVMILASLKDVEYTMEFLGEKRLTRYKMDLKSLQDPL